MFLQRGLVCSVIEDRGLPGPKTRLFCPSGGAYSAALSTIGASGVQKHECFAPRGVPGSWCLHGVPPDTPQLPDTTGRSWKGVKHRLPTRAAAGEMSAAASSTSRAGRRRTQGARSSTRERSKRNTTRSAVLPCAQAARGRRAHDVAISTRTGFVELAGARTRRVGRESEACLRNPTLIERPGKRAASQT